MKEETRQLAEATLEDAHVLHQMVTTGDAGVANIEEEYGLDNSADWLDLLDVMALEIYGTSRVSRGDSELRSITVVTGTGGPHTEFTVHANDMTDVLAVWGSDRAEQFGTFPGLFDALEPLVVIE